MTQSLQFKAEPTDQGLRLDKFLAGKIPEHSRAIFQKLIKEKKILVNGKESKASAKLKAGDAVGVDLSGLEINLLPDPSVKFRIIHDEKDFAVIDKPAGLVVYPGTKHEEKTLVNGLLARWPEIRGVGDSEYSGLRPGIVHRLDKDTSGLMIIAKNNKAFQYFKNLFKEKRIEKTYTALVYGRIKDKEGKIDFPIRRSKTIPVKQVAVKKKTEIAEARPAITEFKVLKYFTDSESNAYTLLEARPLTGRMHQIRVHFGALGHPVVGDEIYPHTYTSIITRQKKLPNLSVGVYKTSGVKFPPETKRHFLHAKSLKFTAPDGKRLELNSNLPDDFREFIENLAEEG